MKRLILIVVALQVVALTSIAAAQSLGDVARREEQRRKAIKKPAKVYTNKDLTGSDIAPPTSTPSSGAFSPGQSGSESAPPAGDSSGSATSEGAPSGDATAEAGALVEVNEKWGCPGPRTLQAMQAAGVTLVASTDAHVCGDVGRYRAVPDLLGQLAGGPASGTVVR